MYSMPPSQGWGHGWMGFDSFNSHISLVEIWRSNQFCCTSLYAFRTGTTYICVGLIILIVAESITPSCRCHRPSSRMLSTSEKILLSAATSLTSGAGKAIPLVQHAPAIKLNGDNHHSCRWFRQFSYVGRGRVCNNGGGCVVASDSASERRENLYRGMLGSTQIFFNKPMDIE